MGVWGKSPPKVSGHADSRWDDSMPENLSYLWVRVPDSVLHWVYAFDGGHIGQLLLDVASYILYTPGNNK